MSELRRDRITGSWVIVAPRRALRPQVKGRREQRQNKLHFDPACPFCPGNEAQLPGIVAETKMQDAPGWRVRVVPNKFPAVQIESEAPIADARHQARPAKGLHEVIIESPWHDVELASMSATELTVVVGVYRERFRVLLDRDESAAAILFRNYGHGAGASLVHPHAQIIALDVVPQRVAAISEWAKRYHSDYGRCPLCEELGVERESGARIVDENAYFVVFVPFAAQHPFELCLVPKRHQSSFTDLDDQEIRSFAGLLGRILTRLNASLGDPPYNFVIESAPKKELAAQYWHWRLRLVPDVVTWGGFELGSGLPINPSSPEDNARLLREIDPGS